MFHIGLPWYDLQVIIIIAVFIFHTKINKPLHVEISDSFLIFN